MTVANLSPAVAVDIEYVGSATQGVVVVTIAANSAAARAGMRVGDVILSVDGLDIVVTKDLSDVTAGQRNSWPYVVEREGRVIRLMGYGGTPG